MQAFIQSSFSASKRQLTRVGGTPLILLKDATSFKEADYFENLGLEEQKLKFKHLAKSIQPIKKRILKAKMKATRILIEK